MEKANLFVQILFKIGVLFLATAALVFWFYSIEMQRYSYHPVDYKNCKLIVLDSKKGVIYALKNTVSSDLFNDVLQEGPGTSMWIKIPINGKAEDVTLPWK